MSHIIYNTVSRDWRCAKVIARSNIHGVQMLYTIAFNFFCMIKTFVALTLSADTTTVISFGPHKQEEMVGSWQFTMHSRWNVILE